jgi:serine/threonine protein kinase
MAACPDDNALADFVGGRLRDDALATMEEHLSDCGACRSAVRTMVSLENDPVVLAATRPSEETKEEDLRPLARVGRYVVLEKIGGGAMGVVYAAQDPQLDRKVALKLLRPGLGRGESGDAVRARVAREAKAMARLSHPNVVTIFDVGTFLAQPFIAMEFIDGTTLRERMTLSRPAWQEALRLYLLAGAGLAAAHGAGLVHRDFKPDNVLVGDDGRVLVTDFGLARPSGADGVEAPAVIGEPNLTRAGAIVGTLAYMAPEQLRAEPVDHRADLFSFCVALYEGLHGKRPFAGKTPQEQYAAIARGAPAADGRVPAAVRDVVLVGLRLRPEDRFPSMQALLDALVATSK